MKMYFGTVEFNLVRSIFNAVEFNLVRSVFSAVLNLR